MTRAQQMQEQIAIEALLDFGKDLPFDTLAAVCIHIMQERPDADAEILMESGHILCRLADDKDREAAQGVRA